MTAHLPPNLLALFAPRPPLPYAAPLEKPQLPAYSGVASYLSYFTDPATDDYKGSRAFERKNEKKERIQREKWLKNHTKIQEQLKEWNPAKDSKATSDAYKTLFVGKLNFNTSEHKLKREFEYYGPVKRVRLVHDLKGRPRGYAFIEFEREKDMKAAYKDAEGKKIDGRRIIVDYERGRTSKSWRPRRLGGGRGGFGRTAKMDLNQKYSHLIRDGSAVPTQTSDEGKDDEKRERERSSERDRERDKSRSDRDARDKSYSSSSSSSKYHDKGSSDRDRGTKRERERDRVGSERY